MEQEHNINTEQGPSNTERSSEEHKEQGGEYKPMIDLPSRYDRWEPLAEVLATILLAIATLSTAWSGYQAGRWGGVQSVKFSQAGALRTESTRASTAAGQVIQIDISIFSNWINAFVTDNQELADFYQERFRDEFLPAFEAWIATDPKNNPEAPKSPFSMPEYQVSYQLEAEQLEQEAVKTFEEGTVANQTGDNYIFNTVILASVLFLAGITSRIQSVPLRMAVVVLALVILAFGLYNIVTLPIE